MRTTGCTELAAPYVFQRKRWSNAHAPFFPRPSDIPVSAGDHSIIGGRSRQKTKTPVRGSWPSSWGDTLIDIVVKAYCSHSRREYSISGAKTQPRTKAAALVLG